MRNPKSILTSPNLLFKSCLLSTCMLTSCLVNLEYEAGNGIPVTETRDVGRFSYVEMDCSVPLTIRTGYSSSVQVTTDENLTSAYYTAVTGNTLVIDWAGHIQPSIATEVVVYLPALRGVVHNGQGTIRIEESGKFRDIKLESNGRGKIYFSGMAGRLDIYQHGSGIVYLEGAADYLSAYSTGNGHVFAENLVSYDADLNLMGPGHIYLSLDGGVLNVNLKGSGDVEWYGRPSRVNYVLEGSGRIIEHRNALYKKGVSQPNTAAPGNIITAESLRGGQK